jgi:hypothetical protein
MKLEFALHKKTNAVNRKGGGIKGMKLVGQVGPWKGFESWNKFGFYSEMTNDPTSGTVYSIILRPSSVIMPVFLS